MTALLDPRECPEAWGSDSTGVLWWRKHRPDLLAAHRKAPRLYRHGHRLIREALPLSGRVVWQVQRFSAGGTPHYVAWCITRDGATDLLAMFRAAAALGSKRATNA